MFRKKRVLLSQLLWHMVFFLSVTIWRDISQIPIWAATAEILDETRWFWLMDAPDSTVENALLIADFVYALAIVELIFCVIYIARFLRHSWKVSSRTRKAVYLAVLGLGLACSVLFEAWMHRNFLQMTDYYFLWQSLVTTEIFSIVTCLFASF